MKKIFSLVCAALLVLSASAAGTLNGGRLHATRNSFNQKQELPAKVLNSGTICECIAPITSDVRKAPARLSEDGVLTCTRVVAFYLGDYYTDADGLWQFQLQNGNSNVVVAQVFGVDGKHIAGTYTFSEEEGIGYIVPTIGDTVYIASGTLSIAYNEATGQYDFALACTGEDDRTFTLSYSCAPSEVVAIDAYLQLLYQYGLANSYYITLRDVPTIGGQTFELEFPGYTPVVWYASSEDFYVGAFNGTDEIWFDWFPNEAANPLGDYIDASDFDFDYCGVVNGATGEELAADSIGLHVTQANDTIYLDVTIKAEDGNYYHTILKNYDITPKDEVNVVFTETAVDTETYATRVIFSGDGDDYLFNFIIYVNDGIVGHYTEEDVYGLNSQYASAFGDYSTMTYLQVVSCSFDITANDQNSYTLTGSLICTNEIQYNVQIVGESEPSGQRFELGFPGYASLDWFEESQDFYAYASNGSDQIAIDWFPKTANDPLGDYVDAEDFDLSYCAIYIGSTRKQFGADSVGLHVTSVNDTIYMDVTLKATDGNYYHTILKNYTITPKEEVNVVFTETEVNTDTEGAVWIIADGDDYYFDFVFFVGEDIVGHYTEEDVYYLNGGSQGSGFADYSTMMYLNVVSCSFDLTANDQNSYTLTGSLVCTNEIQYNICIVGEKQATNILNTKEDASTIKRIKNGQLIIERSGVEYNVMGAQIR